MTEKQKFLNDWKNVNLSELGLSKSVWFKGLTDDAKRRMMEIHQIATEEEAEDWYFYVGTDIEEDDIEDWNHYSEEWFEDRAYEELDYFLGKVFKQKYSYFLRHSVGETWLGGSSYGFYTMDQMKNGQFLSSYDNTTLIKDIYKGKVLELEEFHHDVPMGHPIYLIGLTESQYRFVKNCHERYQREDIRTFAEKMIQTA